MDVAFFKDRTLMEICIVQNNSVLFDSFHGSAQFQDSRAKSAAIYHIRYRMFEGKLRRANQEVTIKNRMDLIREPLLPQSHI